MPETTARSSGDAPRESGRPTITGRLAGLDGLRGLAALMVVLYHFTLRFDSQYGLGDSYLLRFVSPGLSIGWQGVHLFFMVSGFVMLMTLSRLQRPEQFVISRFARIVPTYWFAIAVTWLIGRFLLPVPERSVGGVDALLNGLIIHGYFGVPSVDFVYWTLEIEVFFYGAMFCLWASGVLARPLSCFGAWVALGLVNELLTTHLERPLPWFLSHILLLDYVPYFAIGAAAWVMQAAQGHRNGAWALVLLSLLTIAMSDGLYGISSGPGNALVATAFLLIFLAATGGRWKVLTTPVLVFLGVVSYPLYLLHQNIGYGLMLRLRDAGASGVALVVAALAAALCMAWLVHRWVEVPANRAARHCGELMVRRFAGRREPAIAANRIWVMIAAGAAVVIVVVNRLLTMRGG